MIAHEHFRYDGDDDNHNRSYRSVFSDSHSFPYFASLPPELRAQIWRAAIPAPGINFFNVHSFPGDHAGVNRSDSPPWLYLDMRRLAIEDSDEEVSEYDPSAWQARNAIRRTCREARDVCAIPPDKRATVVLTRPRRGLFIRAGDEQLRRLTPMAAMEEDRGHSSSRADTVVISHMPKASRVIHVHADDILSLSLENCSFNLPYEETFTASAETGGSDDDYESGWAYDPQLTPLPVGVAQNRYCINVARDDREVMHAVAQVIPGMLAGAAVGAEVEARPAETESESGSAPPPESQSPLLSGGVPAHYERRQGLLVMIDTHAQEMGDPILAGLTSAQEVYRDRFGNAYVPLPFTSGPIWGEDCFPYRLTRVWPDVTETRVQYLRESDTGVLLKITDRVFLRYLHVFGNWGGPASSSTARYDTPLGRDSRHGVHGDSSRVFHNLPHYLYQDLRAVVRRLQVLLLALMLPTQASQALL
ncbi:hypothetical protein DL764_004746 [Monosporascus ibericus]|uniref:2EXR domain-containing protein n=1 Tax=Monosporascus ibericus TaxID=155417 RepID=A0A4Q4TBH6_9PEZI|nr:hypothetical protein DL764_004746 [Monosporascus ibericus]